MKDVVFSIRPVVAADLDAVMRIQAQCYPPSMQEPEHVVLSRIGVAGETSLVACAGGDVCAYLFAYPGRLGSVTPLGGGFKVKAGADAIYLHDLAVSTAAAGHGLARTLVGHVLDLGRRRGLRHSALVSVQESQAFWRRLGFADSYPPTSDLLAALATYPGEATYMVRSLS